MDKDITWVTTGDFHLRLIDPLGKPLKDNLNSRLLDKLGVIGRIFAFAVSKKVDFVVITGDIFESSNPVPLLRQKFSEMLEILIANKITTFIVSGNHDSSDNMNAYESEALLLSRLCLSHDIKIVNTIRIMENDSMVFIPYTRNFNKIEETFRKLPKEKRHSITYDNGTEFASHESIEKKTKATVYFANPYHSWERGTNENTNGLLRQFFPKRSSFANITKDDVDKATKLLNRRPRKRLCYLTPKEMFHCTSF